MHRNNRNNGNNGNNGNNEFKIPAGKAVVDIMKKQQRRIKQLQSRNAALRNQVAQEQKGQLVSQSSNRLITGLLIGENIRRRAAEFLLEREEVAHEMTRQRLHEAEEALSELRQELNPQQNGGQEDQVIRQDEAIRPATPVIRDHADRFHIAMPIAVRQLSVDGLLSPIGGLFINPFSPRSDSNTPPSTPRSDDGRLTPVIK